MKNFIIILYDYIHPELLFSVMKEDIVEQIFSMHQIYFYIAILCNIILAGIVTVSWRIAFNGLLYRSLLNLWLSRQNSDEDNSMLQVDEFWEDDYVHDEWYMDISNCWIFFPLSAHNWTFFYGNWFVLSKWLLSYKCVLLSKFCINFFILNFLRNRGPLHVVTYTFKEKCVPKLVDFLIFITFFLFLIGAKCTR